MDTAAGFTIHATKKLLDRVKQPVGDPVQPATELVNWYATALFWKPQVALLVNERTLLPVFMPLAPATTLARRFPGELRRVLDAHGIDPRFVDHEIRSMGEGHYAKTASRSLLGVMNEFTFLGKVHREDHGAEDDLVALSVRLAETPMSPLYKSHISPDHELKALVEGAMH
ncbi:DUF6933 domain-containing protein [Rhabdothermincola sediminis]|uniref:DUF6933 domain-containing protein n=1 Tax=Rhabdothermincola sediminis TaxID=2751370 RepID=UPI001AA04094|nr:hypothetical protein [Rhabdothermincola sediminis]